jgi:hypothetical protein
MRISSAEARQRGYDPGEVARIALAEEGKREADVLARMIDQVFISIPVPSTTLRVARALDDEWNVSNERAAELAKEDPETDWRDVPKEKTEGCQEYFTFSDPAGWRFYLPAFMTHYLSEFPHYCYDAVYWACVSRDHFDELTPDEIAVTDSFLALCHKYENP